MDKRQVNLSVHQWVETLLPMGDLAVGGSVERMAEGSRAHRIRQRSAGPQYQSEIPIQYTVEGAYTTLHISGRIDGLIPEADMLFVEEIKTVAQPPAADDEGHPQHWAQGMFYAAVYCLQHGLEHIGVRLARLQLPQLHLFAQEKRFSHEEIVSWLTTSCQSVLAVLDQESERLFRRNASLASLRFPYGAYRPGQREMAAVIYRAQRDGQCALIEAPTGIGKTVAALFPSLKALGLGYGERIFYLAARTPIKTVAQQSVDLLRQAGAGIRSLTITAKEKCCPTPGTPCHPAFCPRAAGFFSRLPRAMAQAPGNGHLGPEEIAALADKHTLCPFELSLSLSEISDVIICDYNYIYDPRVHLRRFFDQGGDHLVLVDEAHNLVDRAREMFSAELGLPQLSALRKALPRGQVSQPISDLRDALKALQRVLGELQQELTQAGRQAQLLEGAPHGVVEAAEDLMSAAQPLLDHSSRDAYAPPLWDLYFACRNFAATAKDMDEGCAAFAQLRNKRLWLKLYCMDPSHKLAVCHEKSRSTAFFSASLSPDSYFCRLLGVPTECSIYHLPSPFPPENLCVLLQGTLSTTYRDREASLEDICHCIAAAFMAHPGNTMAFFPSYRYMQQAYSLLMALYPDLPAIIQRPGMKEAEREAFLAQFQGDGSEPLLAFVVMGGIFGEGIDLSGQRLIGAVIVGIGLPQVDAERELLRGYHGSREEDGFAFAYAYPGFNRVLQAAGRVIRTESDRGTLLLIDPRFNQEQLQQWMPVWWQPLHAVETPEDIRRTLQDFWD